MRLDCLVLGCSSTIRCIVLSQSARMKKYSRDGMADFVTMQVGMHESFEEQARQQLAYVAAVRDQVAQPLAKFYKAASPLLAELITREHQATRTVDKMRAMIVEGRAECLAAWELLSAAFAAGKDTAGAEEKALKSFTKFEFLLESANSYVRNYEAVDKPRLFQAMEDLERRRLSLLDKCLKALVALHAQAPKQAEHAVSFMTKKSLEVKGARSLHAAPCSCLCVALLACH